MFRFIIATALVMTPHAAWASPPLVSDFSSTQQPEVGAFAGIRLRLPLGGHPRERQVRAVVTVAPTFHRFDDERAISARIGEGFQIGYRSDGQRTFSLSGYDFAHSRLGAAQNADGKSDGGIPTWAIVVGGITAAVGVGALVFFDALEDASE